MRYFFDFDRTVFDTESFKKAVAARPPFREVIRQLGAAIVEFIGPTRSLSKRRIVARTFGTYLSHGRFSFVPGELKDYLYPDAVDFFTKHGGDSVIVTYGVRAFITAKVTSALSHLTLCDVVYTHRKKGMTIRQLCEGQEPPFYFIDDAHFQLESVSKICPNVQVIEIRRDGQEGDGRWPVIHTIDELSLLIAKGTVR